MLTTRRNTIAIGILLSSLMLSACGGTKKVTVALNSTPEGADVYFSANESSDGKKIGTTPFTSEYDFSKKEFAGYYLFRKNGFKPEKKSQLAPPVPPASNKIEIGTELQALARITLTVSTTPVGATIYFAEEGGPFKKIGVAAPKYNDTREEKDNDQPPVWPKGQYKAELKGYKSKTVSLEQTSSNRDLQIDLEPLPKAPVAPRATYPEIRTTVVPPTIDVFPPVDLPTDTPIAVLPFSDKSNTDASTTSADKLIYRLQRKGLFVIEREITDKARQELLVTKPDRKAGPDIDLAKELAPVLNCRYFIFGTVTEFVEELETNSVVPVISESEKQRYIKEYDEYVGYFESEKLPLPQAVKSISEIDQENSTKARSQKVKVARTGLSIKLIDSKNGRTLWKGIVSSADKDLNSALDKAITAIADNIVSKDDKKLSPTTH